MNKNFLMMIACISCLSFIQNWYYVSSLPSVDTSENSAAYVNSEENNDENNDENDDTNNDEENVIIFTSNTTAEVATSQGCSRFGDCKGLSMIAHLTAQDLGWPAGVMCTDLWGWTDKRKNPFRNYIIVCCETGYSIIDVSKPSKPVVVGSLRGNTQGRWRWRGVRIYKNFAYFVSDALMSRVVILNLEDAVDGLATKSYILPPDTNNIVTPESNERRQLLRRKLDDDDESNSENPDIDNNEDTDEEIDFEQSQIRKIPLLKPTTTYLGGGIFQAHNIAINEDSGYAYAVGGGNNCLNGLHMIDIRDPGYPKFAGCFHDPMNLYIHDALCVTYTKDHLDGKYDGREICFAFAVYNLLIIDVTNKEKPKLLSRLSYTGAAYIHQGWLTGDRFFLVIDDERDEPGEGIKTIVADVRDLYNPRIAHFHVALGETFADHNQYIIKIAAHEYTVQANYNGGVRVLRIVRGPVKGRSDDEIIALEEVAFFDTNPKNSNVMDGVWSVYPYFEKDKLIVAADMETGIFFLRRTFDDSSPSIPYAKGKATESPTVWTDCPKVRKESECKSQQACVWSSDWEMGKGWFSACYNSEPLKPEQPYRAPPGGPSKCLSLPSSDCKKYPACKWTGGSCIIYN